MRWSGGTVLPLAYTGGAGASDTPAGGTYAGAESAPAVDAIGGVVFLARVAGGSTSEAIVYRPADGVGRPIVVGDAAPGPQSAGFFAGRPFSAPVMNDGGDIVFRSFVARGPTSVGIFRRRDGKLAPVVRAGDPSPHDNHPPFLDLVGEPSLNQPGSVAFAAVVPGHGRGIYVADAAGLRKVVTAADPAPGIPGTRFANVAPNPSLNDAGAIAFRATTVYRDAFSGITLREEGLFVADPDGSIRPVVYAGDPSPTGEPFFKLRDPFLSNLPSVVFRASLGNGVEVTSGLFVADGNGTVQVLAEHDDLGDGVRVTGFTGDPALGPGGELAFLASRSRRAAPDSPLFTPLGPAILQRGAGGLAVVAARDMPGPIAGLFRTVGAPAVAAGGHIAFRGSFIPQTGGTGGLFLATEAGVRPFVLVKEGTPIGGRFSSFGGRAALNAQDEVAFTASVVKGTARNGIFAAAPTTFHAERVRLRVRGTRTKIALRMRLGLGRLSDGVKLGREPVVVSLADTRGVLWSATVPKAAIRRRGRWFVAAPRGGGDLARALRGLRLQVTKSGQVRANATSARVDLTNDGRRVVTPPLTVTLEVGDDSGTVVVPCTLGPDGGECSA
jgi:hypothetical protein